jgi:hypothetical protein
MNLLRVPRLVDQRFTFSYDSYVHMFFPRACYIPRRMKKSGSHSYHRRDNRSPSRFCHQVGDEAIFFEIIRFDNNIAKIRFFRSFADATLLPIPENVRLFDSSEMECPRQHNEFFVVWIESYKLKYGDMVIWTLSNQKQQSIAVDSYSTWRENKPKAIVERNEHGEGTNWADVDTLMDQHYDSGADEDYAVAHDDSDSHSSDGRVEPIVRRALLF